PRGARSVPTEGAPLVEGCRAASHRVEAQHGIDEVVVVALVTAEVLAPHPQTARAGQPSRTVAAAGGIFGLATVEGGVDERARKLGVMGPRPAVQVVGADVHPDVVDDAHLRVHVDGRSELVLEVVDRDTRSARGAQHLENRFSAGPARGAGEPTGTIGEARYDDDDAQGRLASERGGE